MKKFLSELIGTAFLLSIIVGSGIMGEELAQGNMAITLLANSITTGAGLFVLIQCLGNISGAHFNPIVSIYFFLCKKINSVELIYYSIAQIAGGILGVLITHIMFNKNLIFFSTHVRQGNSLFLSEIIASFGLICTIALSEKNEKSVAANVALYIMAAYWFTSSTSFANPAVTIARSFTNSFTGISPSSLLVFIAAQLLGVFIAYPALKKLNRK